MENVKQIEVKPNGKAEFSLDMTLWDPNSAINLYKVSSQRITAQITKKSQNVIKLLPPKKDGTMVPYGDDDDSKHSLKKTGTKYVFSIKNPQPEDAGFYQVDVEETNVLTTDFQGKRTITRMTVSEIGKAIHTFKNDSIS